MKKALFKNTFREIKNTKARFISIMMIVALGVGFFVGVKSTAPSMEQMAIDYYEETNLMDFRLISTVGFDEDDVKAVENTSGINDVSPSYFLDVSTTSGDTGKTIRLLGAPSKYADSDIINDTLVIEGRMPKSVGEIAIESSDFAKYKIGDKLTIDEKVGDTDIKGQLSTLEYEVVGIVKSPMYISIERGTTTVGNGKIDEFAYIAESNFELERYTVMYATLDTSKKAVSPFSEEYEKLIDDVTDNLELTADVRVEAFTGENIEEAQRKIDDGKKELEEEKAKVEKELADAKAEIEKGEKEYESEISTAQAQIDSAQAEIQKGREELSAGKSEYEKSVAIFNDEINSAKEKLDEGYAQFESAYAQIDNLKTTKSQLEAEKVTAATVTINGIISTLPQGTPQEVLDTLNAYAVSITTENAVAVLNEAKAYLSSVFYGAYDQAFDMALAGIAQLDENITKLSDEIALSEEKLLPVKEELDKGYAELNAKEQEGLAALELALAQLDEAEEKLNTASATLGNSRAELLDAKADGKKQLEDAKKEYEEGKKEAEEEFSKAEKELSDAQKELDDLGEIKWMIFNRDDNPGYSGFVDNTGRVDAVASVFPMFFLLVAMLVCLTTMTRLVEEKRTEIGTFKALGYSDRSITFKFVFYACSAAFLGCVLGCVSCIPTLPRVIYNAYSMLYNMEDSIDIVVDKMSLVLALLAAFACCALVTLFVCYKNLLNKPASLMRPKTPKAGKRILMERITPLWNRFNFSSKVTFRNLFRYKSRLFMTAIGIAGCTALMLTAFGLYNSINDVCDIQFKELCKYNTIIVTDKEKPAGEMGELLKAIDNDDRFVSSALVSQKSISVSSDKESVNSDVYLSVAQNPEDFEKLITLRNRVTKEELSLSNTGAVITEKLAKMLSLKVGDTVYIGEEKKETTVLGITENYVYNYVYMSEEAYENVYGEKPLYSTVYAEADDLNVDVEKELGSDYLKREDVTAISFTSTIIKDFKDMIGSMNMVVLVMIISAGALAIVVLYNLTNINLAERNREIATIKVLGFYHKETSAFVYRENIILTIIGILFGLILGIWLWDFVVKTIEMDTVMFGKSIHAISFVLAAVLTGVFSLVVNFIMFFKIKAINMVESLKSIE